MSKDPAVLWYFGDWLGGTVTLTRHHKGCYMDLLCAQFNSGPLSLEEIKTVLGNDFAAWGVLSKKFTKTEEGLFCNERLEAERLKRRTFVESRKNNLKNHKQPHMDTHMGAHTVARMENENRNEVVVKKGGAGGKIFRPPEIDEVKSYCQERKNRIDPQAFLDHYQSNGWKVGKNPMKDWRAAVRTWERNASQFQSMPAAKNMPPPAVDTPEAIQARKAMQQLRQRMEMG